MTIDPQQDANPNTVQAKRSVTEDFVVYQITSDNTEATVTIRQPRTPDEATGQFLSAVIDYSFSRWMMLEFEKADMVNGMEDEQEVTADEQDSDEV